MPEIQRLFTPDLIIHSHYEGPSGQILYTGYDGMHIGLTTSSPSSPASCA